MILLSRPKLVSFAWLILLLAAPAIRAGQKDTSPPTQPANPTAAPVSCSQINLSWEASTDVAVNGQAASGVQGYYLYLQGSGSPLKFVTTPNATATGLAGNTQYTFQIAAVDYSNNVSTLSVPISATTLPCSDSLAPSVPAGVTATAINCSEVSLSWQPSTDPPNPNQTVSGISGYNLYRGGTWLKFVNANSAGDSNLQGGTDYAYQISALDVAGNESARSLLVPITTPPCPPGPPTGLSGRALNCQRIELSWSAPASTGSGFAAYNVYRDGNFIEQVSNAGFSEPAPAPGASYNYWVTTVDTWARESALSAPVTIMVPGCPAAAPSNLRINRSGSAVQVQWDGTSGALYQAQCSSGFFGPWSPIDVPTTSLAVTNLAIQPSSIYRVALFTNMPAYLANLQVNAGDKAPPTSPLNFNVTAASDTEAALSWDAAADTGTLDGYGQTFTSGIDRYVIYRDGVFLKNEPASASSSSDTTAQADVQYTYSIATLDKAGNRSELISHSVLMRKQCNYGLTPTGASPSAAGGTASFSVSAGNGCSWAAQTVYSWIHINGNSSGNGNGGVSYTIDSNTSGTARSGSITVGTQTFAVSQSGLSCSYSLTPASFSHGSGGDAGSFGVTASPNCGWVATTVYNWIHTAGSGSGNGTIGYTIDANLSTSLRSGTISVGGQSFTVFQAGATAGNLPPVANAGPDLTVTLGNNASFSATGSGDSDGAIASYQWDFGDGTFGSGFSVSHSYSGLGLFTVRLTVTDNLGATGSDTALVTVLALGDSTPPAVSLGVSGSPNVSGIVALDASASDNVGVAKVEFYRDGTLFFTSTATPYGTSFDTRTLANGNHNFSAKAYDAANNNNASTVPVLVDNAAPTTVLTSPASGSTVSNTVPLNATATDNTGGSGVTRVEFYCDNGLLLGSATVAPYSFACDTTTMANANHSFYSKAYDAAGNSAASASVTVTVNNGTPTSPPGSCLWARAASGQGSFDSSDSRVVAVDSGGNMIMAGYFSGTVNFSGTTLSGGNPSLFVAKYAASGNLVWVKAFSPSLNRAAVYGLSLDGSDNIIIAGGFSGTLDFGGAQLVNTNFSANNIFLAKLTSAGAYVWAKQFGSDGGAVATTMAVDGSGNIVVSGSFGQTLNFGGGMQGLTTGGGSDIFLAKFNSSGAPVWVKSFGGSSLDYVNTCAVDSTGSIIIGGYFLSPSINFGNGAMNNQGGRDGFVAKFSSAGVVQATRQFGGSGDAYVNGVSVDANNNIVACGAFTTLLDCGGGAMTSGAGNAIWIAKFSPTLTHSWSRSYGGDYNDAGYAVGVDRSNGSIYLTGHTVSPIDFGNGVWTFGNGDNNVFVTKFSTDGTAAWGKRFLTGAVNNDGLCVVFDAQNNPVITGYFGGVIDFGCGSFTSSPAWNDAAFVLKLAK